MAKFHNSSLLFFNIIGNSITVNLMYNTWGLLFSIRGIKAPQNIKLKTKKNCATTNRNFWQNSSRYQKVQDKWPPLKFIFRRGILSWTFWYLELFGQKSRFVACNFSWINFHGWYVYERGAKYATGMNLKVVHLDAINTKPSLIVSWLNLRFFVKRQH